MRSRYRCSMCPAIHINSRSWLRSSSTHEPSDPPLRVVCSFFRAIERRVAPPGPRNVVRTGIDRTRSRRRRRDPSEISGRLPWCELERFRRTPGRSPTRRFIKPSRRACYPRHDDASRQVPVRCAHAEKITFGRSPRAAIRWARFAPERVHRAENTGVARRPRRRAFRRSVTSRTAVDA